MHCRDEGGGPHYSTRPRTVYRDIGAAGSGVSGWTDRDGQMGTEGTEDDVGKDNETSSRSECAGDDDEARLGQGKGGKTRTPHRGHQLKGLELGARAGLKREWEISAKRE